MRFSMHASSSKLLKEHEDRGAVFGLDYHLPDKSSVSIGAACTVIVQCRIDGDNRSAFGQQHLGKTA